VSLVRAIAETGNATLTADAVLAAMAGHADVVMAERVLAVLKNAATTTLHDSAGFDPTDEVLTLEIQHVFTCGEVNTMLDQLRHPVGA
jgi:hypothetical protein